MDEMRVPPYSKEAEEAVLGAILLNNEALQVVTPVLGRDDFYIEAHRRIYAAMEHLRDAGTSIDPVTLGNQLIQAGDLEKIGGPVALDGLVDRVATVANVAHYAEIVRAKAVRRRIIYSAQQIVADGFADHDGDREVTEKAFEQLGRAMSDLARQRMPASLPDMGDEVLAIYDRIAHGYAGIPLPWPTINAMTSGMWPKTLTMFVARPGVGKSFTSVIAGRHAWMEGHRVLIVSPEMSKDEIAERFFAIHANVSYLHMVRGTMSDYEMPQLQGTVWEAKGKPGLYIMDADDDLTLRGIEAAVRACRPDLLAIDSLYSLRVKGERRDKLLLALEWFIATLKQFRIAGVGFIQLNRAAEVSEKKGGGIRLGTIALADEAGQDAHTVFALEQDKDMRDDKRMRIKPLKLRRGSFGAHSQGVDVWWDFSSMRWMEIPEENSDEDAVPF
jgi:replicative DNA helicase